MKLHRLNIPFAGMLMLAFILVFPVKPVEAVDADVNASVELPIEELRGLIQQLEDVGNQLVGEAGIQMRETIDEMSRQMEQRIDQIENMAIDVIKEAEISVRAILEDLIKQANDLLNVANDMLLGAIECIDEVLAKRITQIRVEIVNVLDRVDISIKAAIDRVYIRSTMLVDSGSNRIAMVMNTTFLTIARIVLGILIFVLLFWMIRALWKGQFPASKFLRIFIPSLVVVLVAGAVYLLVAPRALAGIIGEKVVIPKWENSCNDGDASYAQFMDLYNAGKGTTELQQVGNDALENLNWCIYASASPEIGRAKSNMIEDITAILYPPASVPDQAEIELATCKDNNGKARPSINPKWIDPVSMINAKRFDKLIKSGTIKTKNKTGFVTIQSYNLKISNATLAKPMASTIMIAPTFENKYKYPVTINEKSKVIRK